MGGIGKRIMNLLILFCFLAIFGIYALSIYDYIKKENEKREKNDR